MGCVKKRAGLLTLLLAGAVCWQFPVPANGQEMPFSLPGLMRECTEAKSEFLSAYLADVPGQRTGEVARIKKKLRSLREQADTLAKQIRCAIREEKDRTICGDIFDFFTESNIQRKDQVVAQREAELAKVLSDIRQLEKCLSIKEEEQGRFQRKRQALTDDIHHYEGDLYHLTEDFSEKLFLMYQQRLQEAFEEVSGAISLKRSREVRDLREGWPQAGICYDLIYKRFLTVMETYMLLSTGKVALATDKTSQVAQLTGSLIKNIPGTHSLGSGVQAGMVAGKHFLRKRRNTNVYESFENRQTIDELASLVALKVVNRSREYWNSLEPKKMAEKTEKISRSLYHLITSGKVLKFRQSRSQPATTEQVADFMVSRIWEKKKYQID